MLRKLEGAQCAHTSVTPGRHSCIWKTL